LAYQLILVNGRYYPQTKKLEFGDIIEVCYGKYLRKAKKIHTFFNTRIYKRLRRWSYKNKLVYLQKKKRKKYPKAPKSFKSLGLALKKFGRGFVFAKSLGLAAAIYPIPSYIKEPQELLYTTSILKLHN